jgi:hypothetical protein
MKCDLIASRWLIEASGHQPGRTVWGGPPPAPSTLALSPKGRGNRPSQPQRHRFITDSQSSDPRLLSSSQKSGLVALGTSDSLLL